MVESESVYGMDSDVLSPIVNRIVRGGHKV